MEIISIRVKFCERKIIIVVLFLLRVFQCLALKIKCGNSAASFQVEVYKVKNEFFSNRLHFRSRKKRAHKKYSSFSSLFFCHCLVWNSVA